jgi:hypothetical protein
MTYTETQYNEVLQTTAAKLQELQAKLEAAEKAKSDAVAETLVIAQAAKQAAKLLKDGDIAGAKTKLDAAEKPDKAKRKAELQAEKARIESSIAELA